MEKNEAQKVADEVLMTILDARIVRFKETCKRGFVCNNVDALGEDIKELWKIDQIICKALMVK